MLSGELHAVCMGLIEARRFALTRVQHGEHAPSLCIWLCRGENVVLLGQLDAAREPPPGLELVSLPIALLWLRSPLVTRPP